jgi:hypothetical protein
VSLFLLFSPAAIGSEPVQSEGTARIEQPLIREGTLALELAMSLGFGTNSEIYAESWLGERNIMPRNGWIADYPVTPDIVGELRQSVAAAGDAGRLAVSGDEAVMAFDRVLTEIEVAVTPAMSAASETPAEVTDQAVAVEPLDSFYSEAGPPVVTYYEPPPDYYSMYSWVSYPFWYNGFRFGGFFILRDFHRPVFIGHNHHRGFVSNHVRDGDGHRHFRVDAARGGNVGVGHAAGVNGQARVISNGRAGATVSRMQAIPASVAAANRSAGRNPGVGERLPMPSAIRNVALPARSYVNPHMSAPSPVRSFGQVSSYAPPASSFAPTVHGSAPISHGSAPAFRGNSTAAPAFRGGGGFSGGHGRR